MDTKQKTLKTKKTVKKKAIKKPATKRTKKAAPTIKDIIAAAPKGQPIVLFSKDRKGEIRWTLYAKNRKIIAAASEGFKRKASARNNFNSTIESGGIAAAIDATKI